MAPTIRMQVNGVNFANIGNEAIRTNNRVCTMVRPNSLPRFVARPDTGVGGLDYLDPRNR